MELIGPLHSEWGEYKLLVHDDDLVEVIIEGDVAAYSRTARKTHLIGDLYKEGVIKEAFAWAGV